MATPEDVLARAEALRNSLPSGFRDEVVQSLYAEAERIAHRAVKPLLIGSTILISALIAW